MISRRSRRVITTTCSHSSALSPYRSASSAPPPPPSSTSAQTSRPTKSQFIPPPHPGGLLPPPPTYSFSNDLPPPPPFGSSSSSPYDKPPAPSSRSYRSPSDLGPDYSESAYEEEPELALEPSDPEPAFRPPVYPPVPHRNPTTNPPPIARNRREIPKFTYDPKPPLPQPTPNRAPPSPYSNAPSPTETPVAPYPSCQSTTTNRSYKARFTFLRPSREEGEPDVRIEADFGLLSTRLACVGALEKRFGRLESFTFPPTGAIAYPPVSKAMCHFTLPNPIPSPSRDGTIELAYGELGQLFEHSIPPATLFDMDIPGPSLRRLLSFSKPSHDWSHIRQFSLTPVDPNNLPSPSSSTPITSASDEAVSPSPWTLEVELSGFDNPPARDYFTASRTFPIPPPHTAAGLSKIERTIWEDGFGELVASEKGKSFGGLVAARLALGRRMGAEERELLPSIGPGLVDVAKEEGQEAMSEQAERPEPTEPDYLAPFRNPDLHSIRSSTFIPRKSRNRASPSRLSSCSSSSSSFRPTFDSLPSPTSTSSSLLPPTPADSSNPFPSSLASTRTSISSHLPPSSSSPSSTPHLPSRSRLRSSQSSSSSRNLDNEHQLPPHLYPSPFKPNPRLRPTPPSPPSPDLTAPTPSIPNLRLTREPIAREEKEGDERSWWNAFRRIWKG